MRKTKIVGFSIPPALHREFEALIKKGHKTKSEFFREVLAVYLKTLESVVPGRENINVSEPDLAKALKIYWNLRSLGDTETIIVGLGLIVKDGKILIGHRTEKDKWVENLTWVFPGGRMNSLNFGEEIKKEIRKKTGLKVKVNSLVAARVHPDAGFKTAQVVALYFHCTPLSDKEAKPGEKMSELKWVKPTDVFKHFTTSTCDEVTEFLTTLEKAS
ncbi:MAG: NUDIX domain-containing protein [Candidatus Colwellbacteria bacterium]|nr:NUDIX domain-containing protein [Candidatus Colwellbacteria bacterium]